MGRKLAEVQERLIELETRGTAALDNGVDFSVGVSLVPTELLLYAKDSISISFNRAVAAALAVAAGPQAL